MSFVAHELEIIAQRWTVIGVNDVCLAQAFDNLAQEFALMPESEQLSHFSPGLIEKNFPAKHLLGVSLGKRANLKMRHQFLGLSMADMRPQDFAKLRVWTEGSDALVFYAPKCSEQNLKGFLSWNTQRILNETRIPTLFWGQGWKSPKEELSQDEKFLRTAVETWITRNFGPQKRHFPESQAFFMPALDWILSFS